MFGYSTDSIEVLWMNYEANPAGRRRSGYADIL
jgi:hypothetical protein